MGTNEAEVCLCSVKVEDITMSQLVVTIDRSGTWSGEDRSPRIETEDQLVRTAVLG